MQTHNTLQLLQDLQQQTENILIISIKEWQMQKPETFKFQPEVNAWSAMQCLGHLNAYSDYYLPAIENAINNAKLGGKKPKENFTPGWLGDYFTKLMTTDKKGNPSKKMKASKDYTIFKEGNSDMVIAAFIEQQEKLLSLLKDAKDVDLNSIRIPISIAKFIKLKLGDVFMFLIAHNERHARQAERAITAAIKTLEIKDNEITTITV